VHLISKLSLCTWRKKATLLHEENKIQISFIYKIHINLSTNSTAKQEKIMLHMTDAEAIQIICMKVLSATQKKSLDPSGHRSRVIGFECET
jgi:hypothetical protein